MKKQPMPKVARSGLQDQAELALAASFPQSAINGR
jgi:hypothetical protein